MTLPTLAEFLVPRLPSSCDLTTGLLSYALVAWSCDVAICTRSKKTQALPYRGQSPYWKIYSELAFITIEGVGYFHSFVKVSCG